MKSFFISFEGPDGAGKSTVLKQVMAQITPKLQTQYLVTREPGGSVIAEKIRKIILDHHFAIIIVAIIFISIVPIAIVALKKHIETKKESH